MKIIIGLLFAVYITTLLGCVGKTQEVTETPSIDASTDLASGSVLIADSQELWMYDPSSDQGVVPYMSLAELGEDRIHSLHADPNGRYIYGLLGDIQHHLPGRTVASVEVELIQIDLVSKAWETLFEFPNLFSIAAISPDGEELIVEEDNRFRFCLFNVLRGECRHSDFSMAIGNTYWVDNERFIALAGDNQLYLFDKDTLEPVSLSAPLADEIDILHGSQEVLVFYSSGPTKLFTFNIDTLQTSPLPYTTVSNYYSSLGSIQLSPNDRFLLYSRGERYVIVDFVSGDLIYETDSVFSAKWLSNSQGVVFVRCPDDYCSEVVIFDMSSQNQETVFQSDVLVSLIPIP